LCARSAITKIRTVFRKTLQTRYAALSLPLSLTLARDKMFQKSDSLTFEPRLLRLLSEKESERERKREREREGSKIHFFPRRVSYVCVVIEKEKKKKKLQKCTWTHKRMRIDGIHRDLSFSNSFARDGGERRVVRIVIFIKHVSRTHTKHIQHIYTHKHIHTKKKKKKSNFVYELGTTHRVPAWFSKRGYVRARVRKTGAVGFDVLSFEYGRLRDRVTEPR